VGAAADRGRDAGGSQVDYFGFKITVRNPRLAARLSSDDVVEVERQSGDAPAPAAGDDGEVRWVRRDADGVVVPLRRPDPQP
jgi:hypothetical protein